MVKNWKAALASLIIAGSSFGAGAIFTAGAHAQTFAAARGERGSAKNLMHSRRRLEGVIDQLQRDRHDYGGHRVAAIGDLQQAREQLDEAIEYDKAHPGQ
jgi:hypothetical protein